MIDTTGYQVLEDGTIIGKTGKPLKGYVRPDGYVRVNINGKPEYYHRVVATVLIPNPENKPYINHVDGNKQNNHPLNLEWVTQSENIKHSYDMGLQSQVGEGNACSKLTEESVLEIRWLYEIGITQKELSGIYGVSKGCIYDVVHRRSWKHI